MIERRFDRHAPYRYVLYSRMSDDKQNRRSPAQQRDTCHAEIRRQNLPWVQVESVEDTAITGRLVRKRPNFWAMINDIRTGNFKVDLIVVDTYERYGRADELDTLRRELWTRHGVAIVTADSHFTDPTTPQGKLHATFENFRATEENRIKAHNVLRGKRDAVKLKHWPGGVAPFGYMLKSVFVERHGRQEVDHTVIVPNPATSWIINLAFRIAAEKSWGGARLAQFLNCHPEIPNEIKPFNTHSVNRWLSNPIYIGEYVWGVHHTDIVDDRRIIERGDPEDVLHIKEYCEPIVERELWNEVQRIRQIRRNRGRSKHAAVRSLPEKIIQPIAPGLPLAYPLSGLLRCASCNRALVISSSPVYTTVSGESRRYQSYRCPGTASGLCSNRTAVPEKWLREIVVKLIVDRVLFSNSLSA